MICYVDMEHPSHLRDPEARAAHTAHREDVRERLASIAGAPCVLRHFSRVNPAWLAEHDAQAVVISGNVTDWPAYTTEELAGVFAVIREATLPVLGLCGGMQVIGMAHDVAIVPLRPLAADEADPGAVYAPGYFKEWGFMPVQVDVPDPIFEGLGPGPVFLEAHYARLAAVPPGYDVLASTPMCGIQVIRRRGTLVYGVQFHPEAYIPGPGGRRSWLIDFVYSEGYVGEHREGRVLLANFLQLAGVA